MCISVFDPDLFRTTFFDEAEGKKATDGHCWFRFK